MTERLFLSDSRRNTCTATVLSCEQRGEQHRVLLDRTVFFPNKGGQPCDIGTIRDAVVSSCDEEGELLWHTTDRPLPIGETVTATIDYARRFDIMQQHTGEHLLSYCAWKLFDATNVGFHCALTYATLDLDRPLSWEDVWALERMANAIAAENRPVTAKEYAAEEDLKDVPLRKHAEGLTAPIRVVTIENSDACTCCAPHVRHTGEIGMLKVTELLPYKGGARLTFLCGGRALSFVQELQRNMDTLARSFSTGRDRVVSAVEKQAGELSQAKRELKHAQSKLDAALAVELKSRFVPAGRTNVLVEIVEGLDGKRLRPLAQAVGEERSLCVLFAPCGEQVYYLLASNGIEKDMGELIQAVNVALNGRGGGRGTLAQGSAPNPSDLKDTVEQLRHYFQQVVK